MINFHQHSGIYTLYAEQNLKISISKAWEFFSSPKNLEAITPDNMGFKITSKNSEEMYPGQIITYKVGVFPFVNLNWITEITHVNDHHNFVDEQRFGPYSMWHHEHIFKVNADGTVCMIDKVSYKLPFGLLGRLAHSIFVKRQLKGIFEYRFQLLDKEFNKIYSK